MIIPQPAHESQSGRSRFCISGELVAIGGAFPRKSGPLGSALLDFGLFYGLKAVIPHGTGEACGEVDRAQKENGAAEQPDEDKNFGKDAAEDLPKDVHALPKRFPAHDIALHQLLSNGGPEEVVAIEEAAAEQELRLGLPHGDKMIARGLREGKSLMFAADDARFRRDEDIDGAQRDEAPD